METSRHRFSLGSFFGCSSRDVSRIRVAIILGLLIPASTLDARADWLIIPFFGGTFAGETTLLDLEGGARSKQLILGGTGAWLSNGLLGIEADLAYAPRYFERDNMAGVVVGSQLVTATGDVILTFPLSVTRESLRPYVVGGIGLMHAGIEDILGTLVDQSLLALDIGVGAIGFVSNRTGVRFDLRHVRSVRGDSESLTGTNRARLTFWRATIGVVVRY